MHVSTDEAVSKIRFFMLVFEQQKECGKKEKTFKKSLYFSINSDVA